MPSGRKAVCGRWRAGGRQRTGLRWLGGGTSQICAPPSLSLTGGGARFDRQMGGGRPLRPDPEAARGGNGPGGPSIGSAQAFFFKLIN